MEEIELKISGAVDEGVAEYLWGATQIAAARKEFNRLRWSAFQCKIPSSWALADRYLSPESLKDFQTFPENVQTAVTSPLEIGKGSKISVFCLYVRGYVPSVWYLSGWFVVPKRKAAKTARLMRKTFKARDYKRFGKLMNRFQVVSASEKDALFLRRQDD